eukprot:CAMPEP_0194763394 /NCGR_PEP_ID=MMETSP0323_2-20130528/19203_1 /TAXON_ID=2866 ORGANISM="Crypthecodinium cohnii, Strain Seligo" /NCGR_SAMPLE_ID=MMETSP0323_2 /ASSEMBLY_ACC=CAM_ASM_000346 /LENGTH=33 /DNA_ID= /DNA_START= /DNA_END= /DNA_ORIENTATION=
MLGAWSDRGRGDDDDDDDDGHLLDCLEKQARGL